MPILQNRTCKKRTGKYIHRFEGSNPMWKGNKVQYNALHQWIRRHKPKIALCESCLKNPPYDLANISGEYKRDINDYEWLCRSCHMNKDGRINNLRIYFVPQQKGIRIKVYCLICGKEIKVVPSESNRKFCSNKCHGKYKSQNKLFFGNQFIKLK